MRSLLLAVVGVMSVITTWFSAMDLAWGGFHLDTVPSAIGLLALPGLILLFVRPVVGVVIYYFILAGEGLTSGPLEAILWLLLMAVLANATVRFPSRVGAHEE